MSVGRRHAGEKRSPESSAARLARRQYGVLARKQALSVGLSTAGIARRLRSNRWEAVHPGVYRIAGTPRGWHQELMAACLLGGPGTVASHRAAAALWQLDGVRAPLPEISTPRHLRRRLGMRIHPQRLIPSFDVTVVDRIPVTRIPRTLADLASVVPSEMLEHALDSALRGGHTTLEAVSKRAAELAASGRPGSASLRDVLSRRRPEEKPPESVLERRLMRVLESGGLPRPVPQYEIEAMGRTVARIDLAYPRQHIAIEADGYSHHSGRLAWERDRARGTALNSLGWTLLSFTWDDVTKRPNTLITRVRHALYMRSTSEGDI
jgi:hypothetical protein